MGDKINVFMQKTVRKNDTQEKTNKKILFWDFFSVFIIFPVLIVIALCVGILGSLYLSSESTTTSTTTTEEDVETIVSVTTYVPAVVEEVPSICTKTVTTQNNEVIEETYTECIKQESMSRKEIFFHQYNESIVLFLFIILAAIVLVFVSRLRLLYLSLKFDVI